MITNNSNNTAWLDAVKDRYVGRLLCGSLGGQTGRWGLVKFPFIEGGLEL